MVKSNEVEIGTKLVVVKSDDYTIGIKDGVVVTVISKFNDAWADFKDENGTHGTVFLEGCGSDKNYENFELYKENKFNIGDTVIDDDGDYRKVLGIVNDHYILSSWSYEPKEVSDKPATIKSIDATEDWELYTKEPELNEFTLEDVAKAMNVDVKTLRIKE